MTFHAGDRIRIIEIHPDDGTPGCAVGDVITVSADTAPYTQAPDFDCILHACGAVFARAELIADDPGAEAVDAANAIRYREDRPGPDELPITEPGHGENTLTSKDTNPKDAVAVAHLKFSTIPFRVLAGVALAMSEGAWKYGRHNYRVAGVKASVYFDACMDHLWAWFEGEDIDPDSGRHHIDKAIAGLFVLRDCMLGGKVDDDRPPAVTPGWIAEGHEATKALFDRMREKYPTPKAPFVRE